MREESAPPGSGAVERSYHCSSVRQVSRTPNLGRDALRVPHMISVSLQIPAGPAGTLLDPGRIDPHELEEMDTCRPLEIALHVRAFDAGLRPGPFPDRAASLLPGLLAATRTGLAPAGDDELANLGRLYRVTPLLLGARKICECRDGTHRWSAGTVGAGDLGVTQERSGRLGVPLPRRVHHRCRHWG